MSSIQSHADLQAMYDQAAQAYLRRLRPEDHMEATPQATQREITLESFALVKARRADLHVFNELLVQYPHPLRKGRKPQQVVPDNMLVLSDEPIAATNSFNVEKEGKSPFCVFEYVSKESVRKDCEANLDKCEYELKVPYYLLFYPDNQELTLYRHTGKKYVTVLPNEQNRCPIPELELELGLLEGWVRFWFRGRLLPLPAELQQELDEANRRAENERKRANKERKRANKERQARLVAEQEVERLRAELNALRKSHGGS